MATESLNPPETGWTEDTSDFFIANGHYLVPHRWEQLSTIASLVPAGPEEPCLLVELASGAGVLSELLLQRFARSQLIALDGSPRMLAQTRDTLGELAGRADFRLFDLHARDWLEDLPPVRCFVSSLAIHHLDGPEKQDLFHALAEKLEPGGALLIADIIEPPNEAARALWTQAYDAAVLDQSVHLARSIEPYRFFQEHEWNHFAFPDLDFDKPSRLADQIGWLKEAGLEAVDCFWLRAGHAVYGGFKPV